jgi:hypothetical protein
MGSDEWQNRDTGILHVDFSADKIALATDSIVWNCSYRKSQN